MGINGFELLLISSSFHLFCIYLVQVGDLLVKGEKLQHIQACKERACLSYLLCQFFLTAYGVAEVTAALTSAFFHNSSLLMKWQRVNLRIMVHAARWYGGWKQHGNPRMENGFLC